MPNQNKQPKKDKKKKNQNSKERIARHCMELEKAT